MTRGARIAALIVVIALSVWLLFSYVFPWVDRTLVDDPVLGLAAPSGSDAPAAAPIAGRTRT